MRIELDRRSFCRFAIGWMAIANIVPKMRAKDVSDDPLTAPIHRDAVESSSIASIGFHARLQVLEIEFHSGALYRYVAVPATVFEGLQNADSKGRYFGQRIRGRYQFRRLKDVKPGG